MARAEECPSSPVPPSPPQLSAGALSLLPITCRLKRQGNNSASTCCLAGTSLTLPLLMEIPRLCSQGLSHVRGNFWRWGPSQSMLGLQHTSPLAAECQQNRVLPCLEVLQTTKHLNTCLCTSMLL